MPIPNETVTYFVALFLLVEIFCLAVKEINITNLACTWIITTGLKGVKQENIETPNEEYDK